MRNLSTGGLAYLSALSQANPSVDTIHRHVHANKRSLDILKKSYLLAAGFHLMQALGYFPYLFYPIWSDGFFSLRPFRWIKDKFFGTVIASSTSAI